MKGKLDMTSFAKWMGKSNGEMMVGAAIQEAQSKEQARAVVTTYCLLFDVEVDTYDWDMLMQDIYDHYNCWFDSFEELDDYMCADLV